MYLGSSGHQNLKKELPEGSPPPEPPKASKVAICIRGNVPGEFRSPKPEKGAPGEIPLTRAPKSIKSRYLYKRECTQDIQATKAQSKKKYADCAMAGTASSMSRESYSSNANTIISEHRQRLGSAIKRSTQNREAT
jgi:hypothetical protein